MSLSNMEARIAGRLVPCMHANELFEENEGLPNGSGIADNYCKYSKSGTFSYRKL